MTGPPTFTPERFTAASQMLEGRAQRRMDMIEQFVLRALAIELLNHTVLGLSKRLGVLRYPVQFVRFSAVWTGFLVSFLASFLLQDEFLLTATTYSGLPSFVELVRADLLQTSVDPVMGQLQSIGISCR